MYSNDPVAQLVQEPSPIRTQQPKADRRALSNSYESIVPMLLDELPRGTQPIS